jgi:CRP/FNR family cyclic AMP-dependent transcriptional regulator
MENSKEYPLLLSSLIDQLPEVTKEYLREYFSSAPTWVLENIQIGKLKSDTIFIREETKVEAIYILLEGIVKAIDYRFLGNSYDYMWFYPVISFGSMEVLLDLDQFQTTLSTMTTCTILMIPKSIFEKWVKNDIRVLSQEVKAMGTFLLKEVKRERVFLFMQGRERVVYMLTQIYEQTLENNICIINLTHQDLADSTGLSLKTINRSLKELEVEALINRSGNKIIIHPEQFEKLKEFINQKNG